MSSIIRILFRPLGCSPSIRPSKVDCKRLSCLTSTYRCYHPLIMSISPGVYFARPKTSALVIPSVHLTLSIRLHSPISNASSFFTSAFHRVQVSDAYSRSRSRPTFFLVCCLSQDRFQLTKHIFGHRNPYFHGFFSHTHSLRSGFPNIWTLQPAQLEFHTPWLLKSLKSSAQPV